MQWSPTLIKITKLDHTKPIKNMGSAALLIEFAYLLSGEADEKDIPTGVKLGLSPVLYQRLQEVAGRLQSFESNLRRLQDVI